MPTAMRDPTPSWLKPENASVLDSPLQKILRAIVNANPWPKPLQDVLPNPNPAAIAADPQSQVLALMGADAPSGGSYIKGYHASPHDFEQFDRTKIGTGQGDALRGKGTYIAESARTIQRYHDAFAEGKDSHVEGGGRLPHWVANEVKQGDTQTIDRLITEFEDRVAEAKALAARNEPGWWNKAESIPGLQAVITGLEHVKAGKDIIPPAHRYEVAIKAHPDQFLDWDKPLTEQSPHVQEALSKMREAGALPTGVHAPEDGASVILSPRVVAPEQNLERFGVPGIKYLDQGSRAAGEGSRNYVVFDSNNLIDILRKFGLVLPAAGAAGAASYGAAYDRAQEAK